MHRPNILFIMSDQHSKFHLGCYGDALVRTPHLDRLAAQGMTFTNAYTPVSYTHLTLPTIYYV